MAPLATTTEPMLASSPALAGERVSFTGTLASMTHAQAAELVERHGGMATEHVSRQTTMLVIGEEGWPLDDDGHISVKLQLAQRWRDAGAELRVVNESDWLLLLGLTERRDEIRRLHTPAMLSQLLDVSVHVIRGWERAGLIRPVKRVYRLPYFDFQEVTSARRLSQLLAAGVPRREIEESLSQLPAVLRGDQRPLEQLEILARNAHVVVRDAYGLLSPGTGQRMLDFEPPPPPTESEPVPAAVDPPMSIRLLRRDDQGSRPDGDCDWFVEGCRRYADGEFGEAAAMLRLGLMQDPHNAEAHFHLADCLYRQDNVAGALERYYAAVENDRQYLEAWTQIGCLHRELGEPESALDAFDIALEAHPEYPDAHFQKAETLAELGRVADAAPYWRRYLSYEDRGPWAELARERLNELR